METNTTPQPETTTTDNEENNTQTQTNLLNTEVANTDTADVEQRPTWLPDKFKTAEDLAKSYTELEKTLAEKS